MASVLTTESVDGLERKVGDEVQLVIKAMCVLPLKEEDQIRKTLQDTARRGTCKARQALANAGSETA